MYRSMATRVARLTGYVEALEDDGRQAPEVYVASRLTVRKCL